MENVVLGNLHFIVMGITGVLLFAAGLCLFALFGGLNNSFEEDQDNNKKLDDC